MNPACLVHLYPCSGQSWFVPWAGVPSAVEVCVMGPEGPSAQVLSLPSGSQELGFAHVCDSSGFSFSSACPKTEGHDPTEDGSLAPDLVLHSTARR